MSAQSLPGFTDGVQFLDCLSGQEEDLSLLSYIGIFVNSRHTKSTGRDMLNAYKMRKFGKTFSGFKKKLVNV